MPSGAEEVGLEVGPPAGQKAGPDGQIFLAPSDAGVPGTWKYMTHCGFLTSHRKDFEYKPAKV